MADPKTNETNKQEETVVTPKENPAEHVDIVEQNIDKALEILEAEFQKANEGEDQGSDESSTPEEEPTEAPTDASEPNETPTNTSEEEEEPDEDPDADPSEEPSQDPKLEKSWNLLVERESQLTKERKALKEEAESLKEKIEQIEAITADPVGFLKNLGVTPEELAARIGNEPGDKTQQDETPEQKRIRVLEEERQAREQAEVEAAYNAYMNEMNAYVADNCKYISALGAQGQVWAYAEMVYDNGAGPLLSAEEAAQAVEHMLEERLGETKTPTNPKEEQPAPKPAKKKKGNKTLSNKIESSAPTATSSKPMTEEEKIALAVKMLEEA